MINIVFILFNRLHTRTPVEDDAGDPTTLPPTARVAKYTTLQQLSHCSCSGRDGEKKGWRLQVTSGHSGGDPGKEKR